MFAEERIDFIADILNTEGKVFVKELSNKFNVTEDCIRKDLKLLENKGIIRRTYGGAVLNRKKADYEKIEIRKEKNLESKRLIAKKAFELLNDFETIFLDISTTNIILADLIAKSNKKIIVVTNMIDIILALKNSNVKTICIGGVLSKDLDGFVGSATIENINKYKFDKVFIGSCGVNIYDKTISTFDVDDGNTKSAILDSGKKVYIVMENKKFYSDGVYKFADITEIDYIITEIKPDQNVLDKIGEIII
ncbi:MAG: DeoR/GlpR family DNA-binding transcription regulator [Clostridiaceae bacterium]